METLGFKDMMLKPELLQMINRKGFLKPSPIQEQAIPIALTGQDVMGQAQTGTGKTAAFGIPILQRLTAGLSGQALVLCPTRELAVQVAEEIGSLSRQLKIRVLPVYGGQSIDIQIRALQRGVEVIVGTPGRLLDHLNRGTIKLDNLQYVVVDEADEMLDMGFLPDIQKILSLCPQERQTFLFSATLGDEIRNLGSQFMKDPKLVIIEAPELTVPLTDQYYYEVSPRRKVPTICRVIDVEQPPVSLIFCRTKRGADELARKLEQRGYAADVLHGDMSQRERDHVMDRFRRGNVQILVATDLAARGLDVDMVTHVFNFDIPDDPDSYVHRIGRTGRAGRTGTAISLVEPGQIRQLRIIERHIGKKIERKSLPSLDDAMERRQDKLVEQISSMAAREDLGNYESLAARLLEGNEAVRILGAALKLMASEQPELETSDLGGGSGDTAHVELPIGRQQGIYPRRVVEFITAYTSISARDVGDIEIHGNSMYVEIPMSGVDELYDAFARYEKSRLRSNHRKGAHKKRAN